MSNPQWRYVEMDVDDAEAAIIETAFRFLEDAHYDWYTLTDHEFCFAGRVHALEDALVDAGKQNTDPVYEGVVHRLDEMLIEQEAQRR